LLRPFRLDSFEEKAIWASLVEEATVDARIMSGNVGFVPKEKLKAWIRTFVLTFSECDENHDGRLNRKETWGCVRKHVKLVRNNLVDISLGDDEGSSSDLEAKEESDVSFALRQRVGDISL